MDTAIFFQSINRFDQIVRNASKHTDSEVRAAREEIKKLIMQIQSHNKHIIGKINTHIEGRIDALQVFSFNGSRLVVAGSRDFSYSHHLEIVFDNVFYLSGILGEWDVSYPENTLQILETGPEQETADEEYGQFFVFKHDVPRSPFIVGAVMVSYNTDRVYYYDRRNLQAGERIYRQPGKIRK